jgi:hypothetical protein
MRSSRRTAGVLGYNDRDGQEHVGHRAFRGFACLNSEPVRCDSSQQLSLAHPCGIERGAPLYSAHTQHTLSTHHMRTRALNTDPGTSPISAAPSGSVGPFGLRPRVDPPGVRRFYGPGTSDEFSARHGDLMSGCYDCVARIVFNAYFSLCSAQPRRIPYLAAAARVRRSARWHPSDADGRSAVAARCGAGPAVLRTGRRWCSAEPASVCTAPPRTIWPPVKLSAPAWPHTTCAGCVASSSSTNPSVPPLPPTGAGRPDHRRAAQSPRPRGRPDPHRSTQRQTGRIPTHRTQHFADHRSPQGGWYGSPPRHQLRHLRGSAGTATVGDGGEIPHANRRPVAKCVTRSGSRLHGHRDRRGEALHKTRRLQRRASRRRRAWCRREGVRRVDTGAQLTTSSYVCSGTEMFNDLLS